MRGEARCATCLIALCATLYCTAQNAQRAYSNSKREISRTGFLSTSPVYPPDSTTGPIDGISRYSATCTAALYRVFLGVLLLVCGLEEERDWIAARFDEREAPRPVQTGILFARGLAAASGLPDVRRRMAQAAERQRRFGPGELIFSAFVGVRPRASRGVVCSCGVPVVVRGGG